MPLDLRIQISPITSMVLLDASLLSDVACFLCSISKRDSESLQLMQVTACRSQTMGRALLADRISNLRPTAVNKVLAEVRAAHADGIKTISLMRGQPDTP